MGQINTNNYPTVDSLADADLLIVENATNGTGTTTPKQLRENAIGTDTLHTSAQSVTGAINELKGEIDAGAGVVCYDVNTITSGYLGGQFSGSANLLLLHLTTDGTADATNGYMMMLSYSRPVARFAYGRLVDADGVAYKQDVYADNTIICKISNSGEGTESDPKKVVILGIINAGFMLTPTAVVSDRDIRDGQGNTLSVLAEALTKTASGNPVVITDCAGGKARSLITEIEAIQDLHGYDYPWAGGAGKNKWPFGDFIGTYSDVPFSLKAGTYTASKANHDINCGLRFYYADGTSIAFTFFTSETFTLTADVVKINYSSASATTVNFQLEEGSQATDFAPYSNICPISGRTAVAAVDEGKNKLQVTATSTTINGIAYTVNSDGTIAANNTANNISTLKVGEFTGLNNIIMSGCPSGGSSSNYNMQLYDATTAAWGSSDYGEGVTVNNLNTSHTYYVYAIIRNGVTANNLLFKPMIRLASDTDPTFVPYQHSSATIQLGQTVYGADINWDTGVMTVTDVIEDLGTITYSYHPTLHLFYGNLPSDAASVVSGGRDGISSIYKVVHTVPNDGELVMLNILYGNNKTIWINDSRYTDPTEFKTAVTGQTVTYPLATPTTIQLTPEQLTMLKGYNRVTIESGSIEVGYIAKLT